MKYDMVKLKELCTVNQGLQIPISKRFKEPGENRFFYITVQFLKESGENYYIENPPKSVTCTEDEILVVRTGNTGQVITGVAGCFHNNFFKVTPNERVFPRYLYYALNNKKMHDAMLNAASGTTIPDLKHSSFYDLEIPLPSINIQKKISTILDNICNKLKLNNQINNNLYDEMQTLYNEWFRDFGEFKENSFKDTVLGKIPEKFNVDSIYSISNIIYGAPFKSKLFNEEKNGMPIIRIRDLKEQNMNTYTPEKHPKGYLLQKGDITVGMDGEFRPYFWGNGEAWLNQRVCVFDNKRKKGKAFLYYSLKPLLDFIEKTEVATTVIHIGKNDFDEFKIVLPDEETLNKFDEITDPMVWQIVQNMIQNHKLEQLRDTLLPKLMNGEIDLDNIEI